MKLLRDIDTKILMMTDIGKKCVPHKSTVSKITNIRDQIKGSCPSFQSDRKQMRSCKVGNVDEVLHHWFMQTRVMSALLSGTILMAKLSNIAIERDWRISALLLVGLTGAGSAEDLFLKLFVGSRLR